jgi:hypothetical protein
LLAYDDLKARMAVNAEAIRADPGHVRGADILERIAQQG